MALIAPSILAADFLNLEKDILMVNNSQADWFHLDVMDGVFVPNISYGMPVIEKINTIATKPLDVHLMIVEPAKYITSFKNIGAAILSIHYEAENHVHRTLNQIRKEGMKAGLALNPHTPINVLEDIIQEIDVLLLMCVNPGFGGQKFIEHTYAKVEKAKELILKRNANCLIEVDGGVSLENFEQLKNKGADILVAGNSVFGSKNPTEVISLMKK
ncbi:MAG: ribulose-phosphate 3-epimerase [Solirubrobacteraceae bacterium]